MSGPTPWLQYKRRSDNMKVEARLFQKGATKLMEVKESKQEDFHCPACRELLSRGNGSLFPHLILEPHIFHERYKPT
jgi:hypothetical protein